MAAKYLLAIDAGSGGGRALVFDLEGNRVASAARDWSYYVPEDAAPMGKEFDAGEFWDIICGLIGQAMEEASITSADVLAVSAASQREGTVFLDKEGRELYAGPNVDIRALVEGFAIDGEHGDEVYRITGHKPSLIFVPARLKWFQANRPGVYERIDTVLSISDWIIYRLSGRRVGEITCIADLGMFDIHELRWSTRLIEMLGLPAGVCPEVVTAGSRVGEVTPDAAARTGLAAGTPVAAGGADTQCGLLGMGVRDEGHVGIVAGWSGVVQMVTSKPVIDPGGRIWTGCHVIPGKWVLESNAQESGGGYRWLRELLYPGEDDGEAYALMDKQALEVPPGAGGALAFIGPQLMDMTRMLPSLGGFIFSVTPTITGVGREHLVRAAMECLCYAFRANCAQLEEISGLQAKEVSIGGGLAQSRCLVQILADVLDMPVTAFDMRHVTSWGTAMCAAVGAGAYPDLGQAVEAMRPASRIVEPGSASGQEYTQYYRKWLSTAGWLNRLVEEVG